MLQFKDAAFIKGYVLAAISAITFGLIPLFILPLKKSEFSLDVTLFYRFFIGAVALSFVLLYQKESLKINFKEFYIYIILALCYGFSADFLFLGYDYLTPGIASTILFTYPVLVAIILMLFFKEKLSKASILSLIITFVGIVLLSFKENSAEINLIGLGVCLFSGLCYALYIIIVNKSKLNVSGLKVTFYSLLFTSFYYLIKSTHNEESIIIQDPETLINLTLFSLITTVVSVSALVYAIKYIGSTQTSIMGALEPVVAIIVSVTLFGELITLNLILGVILIIFGVLISILFNKKQQ